jgi:hypothetical protein
MPPSDRLTALAVLVVAGIVLLVLCAVSIWSGRTVGLYGAMETRASIFYWIIVITYGGLGALCLFFALQMLMR